jgi:hypothetical protein
MTKILNEIANSYKANYDTSDVVVSYMQDKNTLRIVTHGKPHPYNNNQTKTIIQVRFKQSQYMLDIFQPTKKGVFDSYNLLSMILPNKEGIESIINNYYKRIQNGNMY